MPFTWHFKDFQCCIVIRNCSIDSKNLFLVVFYWSEKYKPKIREILVILRLLEISKNTKNCLGQLVIWGVVGSQVLMVILMDMNFWENGGVICVTIKIYRFFEPVNLPC